MDVSITIQPQVPAGSLLPFAGSSVPSGFLAADGSTISRTTYARLFAAIGTTYGIGDGSTTFKLPDTRGRVDVGSGTGSGLTARTLAATGGAETHQLTEAELASHTHTQNAHSHGVTDPGHRHYLSSPPDGSPGTSPYTSGGIAIDVISETPTNTYSAYATTGISINNGTATNQNTGGGSAHNNMQPFLVVTKVIKY